jgi:hypothetical protein
MTALRLSSGSVEALKWLALVAMTGDHINAFFYGRELPFLTELGRLAMPLFGMVLAYNMARPKADHGRLMLRLSLFGVLAAPAHAYLTGDIVPVNILFTFAVAAAVQGYSRDTCKNRSQPEVFVYISTR